MLKKKTKSYELDINDISFWRKTTDDKNNEIFVNDRLNNHFILYVDKIKEDNYLDWVTGREFCMNDNGSNLFVIPSYITIPKENIKASNYVIDKVCHILNSKKLEEEYTNISEGIIYYSYFCNIISLRDGIDNNIPAKKIYEEVKKFKNKYFDNNEVDTVKSLIKKKK